MLTQTLTSTGCYLDNHRGHYLTRDVVEFAVSYGFIIDPFAGWAVANYGRPNEDDLIGDFPFEAMVDLADAAIEWLNSGQDKCPTCDGTGCVIAGSGVSDIPTDANDPSGVICRACSGSGRGPREAGQNFPPMVPEGFYWGFSDGDFGLYVNEED